MERREAIDFVYRLSELYTEVSKRFATGDGLDPEETERRLLAWVNAFSDVGKSDALRCLDGLMNGEVTTPRFPTEWDSLPATIRTWCRQNAKPKLRNHSASAEEEQQRCHCKFCFDRHSLTVINPKFVRCHRDEIEEIEIETLPDGTTSEHSTKRANELVREARHWCKELRAGPLTAMVTCCCEGAQDRRTRDQELAERPVRFAPTRMPIVEGGGGVLLVKAMKQFIENNSTENAYTWQP